MADDSKFEWQDRVLAMIDAKKGPFHLRVTVPRQRGGSTFALNLARGRRYRVMHALELQRLRKKTCVPHGRAENSQAGQDCSRGSISA